DTLLLDKTGTITMGNRQATQFIPFGQYTAAEVGRLSALASGADQTPEGKSIVELFRRLPDGPGRAEVGGWNAPSNSRVIEFTAQTRMSGIDLPDGRCIRKGAPDSLMRYVQHQGGSVPADVEPQVSTVAKKGATPLLVCEDAKVAGLVVLEDILKPGMTERF